MRVGADHWLEGVRRKPSADIGGKLLRPLYGVIHYTGGQSLAGAETTLTADDDKYVSSHLLVARDGDVRQLVQFSRVAYHAGKSSWEGYKNLNTIAFGVELVNPGWFRAGLPVEWPLFRSTHKNGGPVREWYTYPPEQIDSLCAIVVALRDRYGVRKWVGHDHISPGRKWDPGPAFPWARIAALGVTCPAR